MKIVNIALVGAGQRGMLSYAPYALTHPGEIKFVAVAEPDKIRRQKFAKLHNIPESMQFTSYDELFKQPKICQAVMIATQDDDHYTPTMLAIEKGYDIILEKPMSNSIKECIDIQKAAEKASVNLTICHVLRYTNFYKKIKEILDSGVIGDIISIQHNENVGYAHYSHSYVRGNWNNSNKSSPMILAKSCHDMDILNYLIGKKCLKISSFGSLSYFTNENAPKDAPKRCTDGCPYESECAYSALKLYSPINEWPNTVITNDVSAEGILKALKEGPYGRCVFHCDNNVVDHQVVNMEYENGITVAFTMCAFTDMESARTLKIMGTKGQVRACSGHTTIEIKDFSSGSIETIITKSGGGHGGGDEGLMRHIAKFLSGNEQNKTSAEVSLNSHLMSFAAEKSRLTGEVVNMVNFE